VKALLDAAGDAAVRERVAVLERATGVEAVAAVIARADSYPEIPWKAFALGAAAALLAMAAAALFRPDWEPFEAALETAVAALAAGGAVALACIGIGPLARLLLPRTRRRTEVLQYAQALFLDAELYATRRRNGVLLLVSLFEREVVLLADRGVRERLGADGLDPVVGAVVAALRSGPLPAALIGGLARLEQALVAHGFRGVAGAANELPDAPIQRDGPA
jgi:putative membrane protein